MLGIVFYLFIALSLWTYGTLLTKGSRVKPIVIVLNDISLLTSKLLTKLRTLFFLLVKDAISSRFILLKEDKIIDKLNIYDKKVSHVVSEAEYYLFNQQLYLHENIQC